MTAPSSFRPRWPFPSGGELRWIAVWARAVLVAAGRRAGATWLGCAVPGAVLFGPNGMRPSDLTGLALHEPGVGLVLGGTWLLVLAPTARVIVRPGVGYLDSLPGNPRMAQLIGAVALVVLQLPWLALWIAGEGGRGLAIVLATTVALAGLARWQPRGRRLRPPAWRRPGAALRAVHLRALRRRAGDALLRGAGLSVIAGLAAGLVVRNNHLEGESAGAVGASVLALLLVPAQVGAALVTLAAHRETAWLAASCAISRATRISALVFAIMAVHVAATAIAVLSATVVAGPHPWLPLAALGTAVGTSLGEARAMLVHEASPAVASRVVVGAVVAAAAATLSLTVLDVVGVLVMISVGAFALLRLPP